MTGPLWTPSPERIAASPMQAFMKAAGDASGRPIAGTSALHAWSVADPAAFWSLVWDFCGVVGRKGDVVLENGDAMPGARFFPEARLNFAENLLRDGGAAEALVFRAEDKVVRRLTREE